MDICHPNNNRCRSAGTHLAVAKAKQQRHAKALARSDHSGRDLVHGFPRRAGFRAEGRDHILEPQEWDQDKRGPDRLARSAGRSGRLVVAVHAAVVPLEAAPGNRENDQTKKGELGGGGQQEPQGENTNRTTPLLPYNGPVVFKFSSIAVLRPTPSANVRFVLVNAYLYASRIDYLLKIILLEITILEKHRYRY